MSDTRERHLKAVFGYTKEGDGSEVAVSASEATSTLLKGVSYALNCSVNARYHLKASGGTAVTDSTGERLIADVDKVVTVDEEGTYVVLSIIRESDQGDGTLVLSLRSSVRSP